jgi:Protein of unknown function (DUF433)
MGRDYVEMRDEGYYVAGTRVPLDVIVYEYKNGNSAEGIQHCFHVLTLEEVYGALAFYLGNKAAVEASIVRGQEIEEEFRRTHPAPPELKARLEEARQRLGLRV